MSIRAVIFDGGGVLVQSMGDRSRKARWEQRLNLEEGTLDRVIWRLPTSQRANIGRATDDEVWQEVAQHFVLNADEVAQLRTDYFSDSVWNDVLIDYVRALRPRVKTGLLSNAWLDARASIRDHINETMFDELIFSAEVGLAKPDRQIYELAVDRLQVRFAEAIFIDDVEENVEVARAIGLAGIRFESTEQTIEAIERLLNHQD